MFPTTAHNRLPRPTATDAFPRNPRIVAFVRRLVGPRPLPPSARPLRPSLAGEPGFPEAVGADDNELARLNRRLARRRSVAEVRWQAMAVQYGGSRRR